MKPITTIKEGIEMKIFIPQDNKKEKTDIRGFWQEGKKLYYDYIKIENGKYNYNAIEKIRTEKNQICLFYTDNKKAFIFYSPEKIDTLKNRVKFKIPKNRKISLKFCFKYILKKYNGFTLYNEKNFYVIEIWQE